ncbi:membrane peptidoglycan carboxypeptidase [Catenulispora sp. MAP5-51]|uniref:penicillin-binding transpeptidase domain-containing protein n=1 Tax=Catenulispora sp. MAP5-51 TaxID=3156298 RepID=UPI003518D9B4
MSADKRAAAQRDDAAGREALENQFRTMFAERSETVRVTTAPYANLRRRIVTARRRRRMRIGSAGVAFAVAVVGVGVWATVPGGHHAAVAPTTPGVVTGVPAKVVYADGHTEVSNTLVRDAALDWLRTNYTGDLSGTTVVTTFDQQAQGAADAVPDSSAVIVDADDGAVLALGDGWNRPLPIADLMKPILLAAAFQTGKYGPDSMVPLDTAKHPLYWPPGAHQPMTYQSGDHSADWPPESPNTSIVDYAVSLRSAAQLGANGPFAQVELGSGMSPSVLRDMGVSLGLPSATENLVPVPSLVLGPVKATPLTMATVNATFADGGVWRESRMVGKLLGKNGRVLWTPQDKASRVLSQAAAAQVTDVLHSALADGTTGGGLDYRTIAGARTWAMAAASSSQNAAWTVGADSRYVISVGMSREDENGNLLPLAQDNRYGPGIGSQFVGKTWAGLVQAVRKLG